MRNLIALALFVSLSVSATANPCGGPCGGSSMPTTGGTSAPPNMGAGGRDGEDADFRPGPKDEPLSRDDAISLVNDRYGGRLDDASKDPRVKDFLDSLDADGKHEFRDQLKGEHEYYGDTNPMMRIDNTATKDYVCHDYAWSGGKREAPPGGHIQVDTLVQNPDAHGFTKLGMLDSLQPGDIVVYHHKDGNAAHSGLVVEIGQDGNVYIHSKDGSNSIFRHTLGGDKNFFRDTYGAGGMTYYRPGPNANPYNGAK